MLRQSALLSLCELKLHGSLVLYLLYNLSCVYSYHMPRFSYRTFVFACPYWRQGSTNGCVLICDQLLNDVFHFKALLETLDAMCSPKVCIFHHIAYCFSQLSLQVLQDIHNKSIAISELYFLSHWEALIHMLCAVSMCVFEYLMTYEIAGNHCEPWCTFLYEQWCMRGSITMIRAIYTIWCSWMSVCYHSRLWPLSHAYIMHWEGKCRLHYLNTQFAQRRSLSILLHRMEVFI